MVFTYMPGLAYAAAGDETEPAVTTDSQEEPAMEEAVQTESAESDEPVDADVPSEAAETEVRSDEAALPEEDAEEVSPENTDASDKTEAPKEAVVKTLKKAPVNVKPKVKLDDSDELLMAYLENAVAEEVNDAAPAGNGKEATNSRSRINTLENDAEYALYEMLESYISYVASGEESSTEFTVSMSSLFGDKLSYTEEELGTPIIVDEQISDAAIEAFDAMFECDVERVVNALMADMPFELYWYDKTEGYLYGFDSDYTTDGESLSFDSEDPGFVVSFYVSPDYSADGSRKTMEVNTEKTSAAASFVSNTVDIINGHSADSDVEKLYAYKEAVCEATDYNDAAAATTWTKGYGDPWQLIYVFDGDTSTKVVCEGYSKAFQFLCDRTEFNNTGIEAYSVTGVMDGGTGAGAHMWNILHMDDGNNYIADVTNCDEGNIGAPDDLFLKGCAEGSVDGGYSYACGVDYTYDTDTRTTYSDEELVMSASDYVEGSGDNPDDPDDPTEEISSISYTTADGKGTVDNPIVLTEGIDGQDEYNGNQETYFNYEYYCNEGDLLTINYGSDGEESVTYHYEDGDFVDEDNNYSDYNPSFSFGDQEESPLEPGKTYSAEMSYGDQQTCNVYFSIAESPIASVSFTTADGKGTADDPIVLTEGLNGEYDEDVFFYEYYFKDGDALTVTYTDESRETETYYYDSDRERFKSSAGKTLSYKYDGPRFRSTQSSDPWEPGNDYSADISFGGRSAKTYFRTVENPYASAAFTDAQGRGASADNPIPVIEGSYGYYNNNEDVEWFYYEPEFNQGDELTVDFKDETKDSVTYYYDRHEEGFYNSEGEYLTPSPYLDADGQWSTHWEKGNVYEATLDFANIETTVYYKVIENPVKKVSFSREGGVQITEGADGVNSDGGDGMFFEYYLKFEEGDVITVKIQEEGKEPVDVNYVGVMESDDGDEYIKFVNKSDEKDYFYADEIVWNSEEQSAGTEWKYNDGKDHWFTIEYMGVESEPIPVTMLQNPVSSFTFERDGGVNLMDGVDGVNSDGGDEEFFEYRLEFKPGDQIIVTKPTGGMNRYEAVPENEDSTEVSKFVLKTSEGFVEEEFIDADRIMITDQPSQWETHWGLEDGIEHSFMMQYSGRTYEVPVTLVANPVEGISFSRGEYGDEHPIELMDQVDGWHPDDNPDAFIYDLRFKEGDILTVTWEGNDYSYVYTYSQGDEDDAFVLNGEYSNKPKDLPESLTGDKVMTESELQSADEPWGLNEEHIVHVTYNGRKYPVNVITVGNPIEGVSFSREGYDEEHPIELMYKVDGWYNNEENRFFYGLWFNEGDELTVTVGGTDYTYTYTVEEGNAEDSFVLKDGYSNVPDVLPQKIADSDVWIEDDQYDNPWKTDEDHVVGITYKGRSYSVNVHTTENPVEGISFARYDDEGHVISPIELMDKVDGWYEDDDPDRFWYALWFSEGDELTVTWRGKDYTYIFTCSEQADEEDAFVLKSGYTNVPEDLPQKITDDVWTDSDQEETEWSVGDTNHEFNIRYMGDSYSVPVKIVANSGKIDINKCEVSFNEDYLVNEDIASTEYTDWFFVIPDGEVFEPIVKDGDKTLGPESYSVRYREQEFDVTADDGDGAWGPKEGAEWLNTFPTETGVYFIEVYGAGEYTGLYNGMFPLVRIGDHNWSDWTVTKEATCTTKGEKERTCSHCKVRYTEEISVDPEAHDWSEPSYAWADDNSTCSALRLCGNSPAHIESETANAEHKVIKEATETENGEEQWTATFKNEAFETQTKTKTIPAITHTHSMTHTDAVAATCTEPGNSEYWYCSGCDKYFSDEAGTAEILEAQTVIPAKGHTWGTATYTWADDYTEVTGTHSCTVCHESVTAVAKTASSEVTKAPTATEDGEIVHTSAAFVEDGFEVQTVTEKTKFNVAEAIEQAEEQTQDADGKASAVENSTNEGAISDAEDSAIRAAALASLAEEAAQTAFNSAKSAYDNLPADASETYKQTALANYENAVTNLAVAKQLKAAASSAVAKSKKAAANVAARKAAAAYNSANSASSSAAAEAFRKEAETQAAIAAQKASAADTASADAAKAVSDLGKLAEEIADAPVANTVEEAVEAAKTEANTSAGTASEASTAADTSSGNAKTSADKAKDAVNNKAKAEADAAKAAKAAAAAKAVEDARQGIPDGSLPKVKIKKPSAKKTSITVKWTKLNKKQLKKSKATHYEIWVSESSSYPAGATTKEKIVKKSKSSWTCKGLKKNKKYYVKIRAIKYVGGAKHVGKWKQKTIKTKKK